MSEMVYAHLNGLNITLTLTILCVSLLCIRVKYLHNCITVLSAVAGVLPSSKWRNAKYAFHIDVVTMFTFNNVVTFHLFATVFIYIYTFNCYYLYIGS